MLKRFLVGCTALLAGVSVVRAAPADDVQAAAKKLADSGYSWRATTENAGGGGGGGGGRGGAAGPQTGKVGKDGVALVTTTRGENATIVLIGKDGKGAVKAGDGPWQSAAEAGEQQGPGRASARMIQTFKAPAAQALTIAAKAKDLKKTDDGFVGDLTEEGVKEVMTFGGGGGGGRRGGGNNAGGGAAAGGPQLKNGKGTVTFAVKDGALARMKYTVQGTTTGQNGQDREVNRTTTVEFTDVGSTQVEIPADAKSKAGL